MSPHFDHVRITPLDVLYLRGNRLFAETNDAEPLMPPWPSLFSGALRSRMLADAGAIGAFARNQLETGELAPILGSGPGSPGTFRLAFACLEREGSPCFPLPADTVVLLRDEKPTVHRLQPEPVNELGVQGSFDLPCAPVLRTSHQAKPESGYWITADGMRSWQRGRAPSHRDLVHARDLWKDDPRLGIALSPDRRTAEEGMLYTTRTVALSSNVGFLAGVAGASGQVPTEGLLRLGGDGRGASLDPWQPDDTVPWKRLPNGPRFTVMLATPGIFPGGWLLPGTGEVGGELIWRWGSLSARLRAASVTRPEVVSGWDLAHGRPKTAVRAAAPGSVYWLELVDGDLEELEDVLANGLWLEDFPDPARRAEGFNNVWFGDWAADSTPVAEG